MQAPESVSRTVSEKIPQDDRFRRHLEKWRKECSGPRPVLWRDGWLENGYCGECRYCCGPQGDDEPFPMPLLPKQTSSRTPDDFYMLDARTACLGRLGCKSETPQGCRLPRESRPVACGLFPIVIANGALYLYKTCPAVMFNQLVLFADLAAEAAEWLNNLAEDDLRRLSLNLPAATLAKDYIDLGIRLFTP